MALWTVLLIVVLLGGVLVGFRRSTMNDIDPEELQAQLGRPNGPCVLDVRSADEYRGGHVPGALNIPVQQLSGQLQRLETVRGRRIVVTCEHGMRAQTAMAILRRAGFTDVTHLAGDMSRWRAEGRPVESGGSQEGA